MARHVGRERCGQRVERQLFQHVGQLHVELAHADQRLQREHGLHHGAGLRALGGAGAGQMLVAGEHAVGHAVILHQPRPAEFEAALLLEAALEHADHARRLQTHGHVHHVGGMVQRAEVRPLRALQLRLLRVVQRLLHALPGLDARHGLNDRERMEKVRPVQRLGAQLFAQLQQIGLPRQIVQPQRQQHVLAAARHGPVLQRMAVQIAVLILEEVVHQHQHALVSGGGEVLLQRLHGHHQRPMVAILLRSEPSVRLLGAQNPVHIPLRQRLHVRVVQRPGQRDQAIQIVGRALPAVAVAAQPGAAVAHVRPDVVQSGGQALRLNAQLVAQPALGLYGAQRQLGQLVRSQRSAIENRFHHLNIHLVSGRPRRPKISVSTRFCVDYRFCNSIAYRFGFSGRFAPGFLPAEGRPGSKMWYSHSIRPL